YEFPSSVFIGFTDLVLNVENENLAADLDALMPFLQQISALKTPYGFPIQAPQKGIVLIADEWADERVGDRLNSMRILQRQVDDLNSSAHRLVFSVCILPKGESAVSFARAAVRALAAQAAVIYDPRSESQTIVFPASTIKTPALQNQLPLWPPLYGFEQFSVTADVAYLYSLGKSLYLLPQDRTEEYTTAAPSEGARSLLLKRIQTIEAETALDDSIKNMSLLALYRALMNSLPPREREIGWVNLNYADRLQKSGDVQNAVAPCASAMQNFIKWDAVLGILLSGSRLADYLQTLKQLSDAETALLQALTFAQGFPETHAEAEIYYRLASLSFTSNRRLEAWERFGHSVESYFQIGDTLKAVQIYTKMGILMRESNALLKSEEYLERSLQLAQDIKNEQETAIAHYQLAATQKRLERVNLAISHFEAAADAMEIMADWKNLANCQEHIGDLLIFQGELLRAQYAMQAAVRYYRVADDVEGLVRALVKSADISVQRSKWLQAHDFYDQALSAGTQLSPSSWDAVIMYKKGLAHVRAGDL
ncbi:MAG: tetratricopeptide repeat protein, partial [Calditrichaeota bacterium]